MASKKDFTKVNTNRVYSTIAEATEEPETIPGQMSFDNENMEISETQVAQDEQPKKKRTCRRIQHEMPLKHQEESSKLPRINMAFTWENYDFIRTMANVRGQTITEFVNHVIELCKADNEELYQKAIEFRNSL